MLIEDNAVVEVVIYYRKNGKRYDVFTANEFKKSELTEEKKTLFSTLKTEMKELTWGLYNELQESAMVESGGFGERTFNFKIYKETRLKRLLVKWDAKDKENKPLPINDKILSQLAPSVAEAILRAYDEVAILDGDEEKNS
jgi:hypothetical protein